MNKEGKVWGYTSPLFNKNNVEIHRIYVDSESWCSKHKHEHKYNLFFVEEGSLIVRIWKNDYPLCDETVLHEGESITVSPGEWHEFQSTTEPAKVLEIYWTEINPKDIIRETCGGKKE